MELVFFFYFFIFLFGLAIGSLLNCIIYRLEIKESFLSGRSYCPYCKHELSWQDLIPVLSFFVLKGKCRYCKKKISWRYPLVELFAGFLFVFVAYSIFFDLAVTSYSLLVTGYRLLVVSFLIIIFVYDLKHYIIPDEIIYPVIVIAFLYQIFNFQFSIFNPILSALGATGFFLLIFLFSRGKWLGFGDVKLAFFMGLFLGFPNILVALFLAFSIGAIIGIELILSGKKTLKSQVPFGPFLVIGTLIALFLGNQIINWYSNLLNLTI